jgi:hypothetical protein
MKFWKWLHQHTAKGIFLHKTLWTDQAFLAYIPYFEKYSRLMISRCCLCIPLIDDRQRLGKNPLIIARQRLGKNSTIVARQLLGKNPLIAARERLGKNPLITARQRLGRNVTVVTNTHATIEELLDASFSMWPVSYESRRLVLPRTSFLRLRACSKFTTVTSGHGIISVGPYLLPDRLTAEKLLSGDCYI